MEESAAPDPATNQPDMPPCVDEDEPEGDELEEFFFFKTLEENQGKPTRALLSGGCFMVFPAVIFIAAALFFLMTRFYN